MGAYAKKITIALSAASVNNICLSQSNTGAVDLLLNGSTAGVLDAQRQVLFTFAGNESAHSYTVYGTNQNGETQSEVVTGTNGTTAVTTYCYKTVTRIAASATSTSTITVGTNGVAYSAPYILDRFISATNISAAVAVTGTVNYSVQVSYDNFAPAFDYISNTATWYAPPNTSNLTAQTSNKADVINMPVCAVRLLQNSFSTGATLVLNVNVPMGCVS